MEFTLGINGRHLIAPIIHYTFDKSLIMVYNIDNLNNTSLMWSREVSKDLLIGKPSLFMLPCSIEWGYFLRWSMKKRVLFDEVMISRMITRIANEIIEQNKLEEISFSW